MTYQITREIRLYHEDDGWFFQFQDDGNGIVEVSSYETQGIQELKTGQKLHIPKDCIENFISILQGIK